MSTGSPQRREIAGRLAWVVGRINRRLRPPADALSHVATSALSSIQSAGSIRPGDLARVEGIAAPGMTRLVAELESRGLVRRDDDPDDRRSTRIRLSEAGERALLEARAARAASVGDLLRECDDHDLATVSEALVVLEAALARRGIEARGPSSAASPSAERGFDAHRQGVDPALDDRVGAPALLEPTEQR
ncbi:MarR family winged helix-turn-helix transcriptional regulator [Amnibacterium sp. CER49]|uniref:MarR family winged helix-turn-helix transcriptional regulator n=1 Tax=Amnibacterium sp. CER49 TaxID=3039161 RepID=UPI002448A3F4|nr:MarR family winged helix-turn-helix transcriptional regulator [Amnibacterium sp. CER49]MDH2444979.1 MarR family winged helix-turn-helix transcriptional regulator [Amnibacterium sp. CER49]